MDYDDIPWTDSKKWNPGDWYPLPVTSTWCKELAVVDGYMIFYQDPEGEGDILPIRNGTVMTFKNAVSLCESRNRWSFNL